MENTITVEEVNQVERKVNIIAGKDFVDNKFNDFFTVIQKETEVPGWRKGKAPIKVLKSYFKDRSKSVVEKTIVAELYKEATEQHNIAPVSAPKFDKNNAELYGTFDPEGRYNVSFTVEVLPVIDPVGYKGLDIDLPEHNVDDLCEQKMLEYRKQFAEREQVIDGKLQKGDTVVVDFTGFIDGEKFDGGSQVGHTIEELGSGTLIPGFEDHLVDMEPNTNKRFTVKFPDDYYADHLAGVEVEFDVKVNSIVRKKLADVDNDLAMMVGFESVEELQENVKNDVLVACKNHDRSVVENKILTDLLEKNEFDIPQTMLENEKNRMFKQIKDSNQNITPQIASQVNKLAENSIRKILLLDAIYEKEESLELTPDELDEQLNVYSKKNNMSKSDLLSNLNNSGQMDDFVRVIRVRKVVDFILDNKQ